MSETKVIITASINAYEKILDEINNSSIELPNKIFKVGENGYIYYFIESLDCFTMGTIDTLIKIIEELNDTGNYAVLNIINN
ncbi:hypothetical protein Q5X62_03440 [Acinetobacter baumannii]|nr:hypothetical protein [Acinetobacter baumannii]